MRLHMVSGRLDAALTQARALTATRPRLAEAWLVRGIVERLAGDLPAAEASLRRAETDASTAPRAAYQRAVLAAQEGRRGDTLGLLARARASGQVDITRFAFEAGTEALRDDPQFVAMLPSPTDLAHPFVEPVRVIHEWRGEARGDAFGWIARNIGDTDGDGVDDATVSAPNHDPGRAARAGKVYVYSGRSGALRWARTATTGAQLGLGVEAAGDVDGDGTPDVVAGAPGAEAAYVFSGKDGRTLREFRGRSQGDQFGRKVSDLGDVNGDGHADVLVGAPGHRNRTGAAYVFSGQDGRPLLTLHGETEGDRFGSAAGGRTLDGRVLFAVGAPDAGPGKRGRVYVYRGLGATPTFVLNADDAGAEFGGMFISIVGDVDGDGVDDVYASDWSHLAKGWSTGRAYVYSGASGARLHVFTGEAAGDGMGIGVADVGDIDGDRRADLLIGAWQHGGAAAGGGKVYLYSGATGSLLQSYTARVMGETFGFDTTGLGDVDGDTRTDFLITSGWSPTRGPRSGRVFVVAGPGREGLASRARVIQGTRHDVSDRKHRVSRGRAFFDRNRVQ